MKQAAMLVITLALGTFLYAEQQTPATQNQPAGKPGSTSQGAQPATPAQGAAAQPAQPQGKRPPQAKTQPEFDAYKAATANTSDPAALEKAADDFAAKFPDSELRPILYRTAMHSYQAANNADKMLEMGRKVLKFDPDDPEALPTSQFLRAHRRTRLTPTKLFCVRLRMQSSGQSSSIAKSTPMLKPPCGNPSTLTLRIPIPSRFSGWL